MEKVVDHFEILRNVEAHPDLCPYCGSVLILKQKAKAKFFACPRYPDCRYTKPVDHYRTKEGKRYCEICQGEQKIPLKNKAGEIVPYAWIFCECREEGSHSYLPPLSPEQFDFPMSYDFYRSLCLEHSWPDPGPQYPPELVESTSQVTEVIHRHSDMSQKDFDSLQQTSRKVKYLLELSNKKVNTKRKSNYKYK